MGLPWIQVEKAFLRGAALMMAAELEVPKQLVCGCMMEVWAWCSDNAPDGVIEGPKAVSKLEAAAGWTGERGALAAAAISAGIVDGDASRLRIKGMDRYEEAVRRAQDSTKRKREWRAKKEGGDAVEPCHASATQPPQCGERVAHGVASLPSTISNLSSASKGGAGGGAPPTPAFFAKLQAERLIVFPNAFPEAPPSTFAGWYGKALGQATDEVLLSSWGAWLREPFAAGLDPPGAVRVWMTPGQWPRHLPGQANGAKTRQPPGARFRVDTADYSKHEVEDGLIKNF